MKPKHAPAPDLIHPDYRVWFRHAAHQAWQERPVHAMMADMRRPRWIGHAILPTDQKVFLKITTVHNPARAEIRPTRPHPLRKGRDGSFRLALSPHETLTLQFNKDPGLCLHLSARPRKLGKLPHRSKNVIHFPSGVHHLTDGVLQLESGQILHLDDGAVLRGRLECNGVENILIRGLGLLDLLPNCPSNPQDEKAPKEQGLKINNSKNIRVEGITIRNPSHYGILLAQSKDIHISHVNVFTHCLWGDGIDSMACSDLTVEHCFIRTSDDCLAIYADRGAAHGSVRHHCYRRCTLWADVAHPVMMGVHGKQSPPGRILEDLKFEKLVILRHCEPTPMYQGCLAVNPGDLNTVRHIHFSDIRIEDPEAPRLLDLRVLFNPAYNPVPGKSIQAVRFDRVSYLGNPLIPSVIEGYSRHRRVSDIQIKDLRINGRLQKTLPGLTLNRWADPPRIS